MLATPEIPYVVGIAGGTGSGKTTLAKRLCSALPEGAAAIIHHDAYYRHRPELSDLERDAINFDHPDALDNALLVRHLDELRAGHAVGVPIYDFETHLRRPETSARTPVPILIVEGILSLADAELRRRMNLKIFVEADSDIRLLRRLRRDVETRGRTLEQVRQQYEASVRPMHLRFVEPSRAEADLVVPAHGENSVAVELVVTKLRAMLGIEVPPHRPEGGQ